MLVWLLYLLVLVVLSAAFVVGFGMLFGRGSARRRLGIATLMPPRWSTATSPLIWRLAGTARTRWMR